MSGSAPLVGRHSASDTVGANQNQTAKPDICRSGFLKSETWQDFNLYFTNAYSNHDLEFRIYYHKKAAIWADKVMLRTN